MNLKMIRMDKVAYMKRGISLLGLICLFFIGALQNASACHTGGATIDFGAAGAVASGDPCAPVVEVCYTYFTQAGDGNAYPCSKNITVTGSAGATTSPTITLGFDGDSMTECFDVALCAGDTAPVVPSGSGTTVEGGTVTDNITGTIITAAPVAQDPAFDIAGTVSGDPAAPPTVTVCESDACTLTINEVAADCGSTITGAIPTAPGMATICRTVNTTVPAGCPMPMECLIVVVLATPPAPAPVDVTFCFDEANPTVSANGGGGTFEFFGAMCTPVDGPCGTMSGCAEAAIATGDPLVVDPTVPGIFVFNVVETSVDGCESAAAPVSVTVIPEVTLTYEKAKCDGDPDGDGNPVGDVDEVTYNITATLSAPFDGATLDVDVNGTIVSVTTNATDMTYTFTSDPANSSAIAGLLPLPVGVAAAANATITVGAVSCMATVAIPAELECSCFVEICEDETDITGLVPSSDAVVIAPYMLTYVLVDGLSGAILQEDAGAAFDLTPIGASNFTCEVWSVSFDSTDGVSEAAVAAATSLAQLCALQYDDTVCVDVSCNACYIDKLPIPVAPVVTASDICEFGEDAPLNGGLLAVCDACEVGDPILHWFDDAGVEITAALDVNPFNPIDFGLVPPGPNGLTPGDYNFTAVCECVSPTGVSCFSDPSPVVFTVHPNPVIDAVFTCGPEIGTGEILVTITGPTTGDYIYTATHSSPVFPPGQGSFTSGTVPNLNWTFSGLENGTWTLEVEDANGCVSMMVMDVTTCDDPMCIDMIVVCEDDGICVNAQPVADMTKWFLTACASTSFVTTPGAPPNAPPGPMVEVIQCLGPNPDGSAPVFDMTGLPFCKGDPAVPVEYNVFVLNYDSANPPAPIPAVGDFLNTIGSTNTGCYNEVEFLQDYLCFNVNPKPVPNAFGPYFTCPDDTPLLLTGQGTDVGCSPESALFTYQWTISVQPTGGDGVLTGDDTQFPLFDASVPGMYEVTLVVTNGSPDADPNGSICSEMTTATIRVHEEPLGADGSVGPKCSDDPFTYPLDGFISNNDTIATTFTWVAVTPVPVGLVAANGGSLNLSGSGPIAGEWINETAGIICIDYIVTPTSKDGCIGDDFTVNLCVDPEPVGVDNDANWFCSSIPYSINPQDFILNGVTSSFTWSATADPGLTPTPPTPPGSPYNGTGNFVASYENITGGPLDVVYTVVPTSVEGAPGLCEGAAFTVTVTIHSEPVGEDVDLLICSEDTPLMIDPQDFITNGVTSDFSWTGQYDPEITVVAGVSGIVGTGSGSIDEALLNIEPGSDPVATYLVTPISEEGCVGTPFLVTITVPLPNPSITADVTEVCVEEMPPFLIYGFLELPPGTFSITATTPQGGGGTIGVLTDNGDATATFDPQATNVTETTIYTITYDYADTNGCNFTASIDITVHPFLTATMDYNGPLCEPSTLELYPLVTSPYSLAPYSYDFTAPNGDTYTTADMTGSILVIDPTEWDVHSGTWTVMITDANGCRGFAEVEVIINSLPIITLEPVDQYVCEGDFATFTVEAFAATANGNAPLNYEWYSVSETGEESLVANSNSSTLSVAGTSTKTCYYVNVIADQTPDPDCVTTSETACLIVHLGGALACNDAVNASLDENCTIHIQGVDAFLEGDQGEEFPIDSFYTYVILDPKTELPIDVDLIGEYVGQCLVYNVFDKCTGNYCWGEICIEDKIAPEPNCQCSTPYMPLGPSTGSGSLDSTDDRWNRPGSITGPGCLNDPLGVNSYYDVIEFHVIETGPVNLEVAAGNVHLSLYETCFDKADPCNNLIAVSTSSINMAALDSEIPYVLVVSSTLPYDSQEYVISSTGNVRIPNPECVYECYDAWDLDAIGPWVLPDVMDNIPNDNCFDFDPPVVSFSYIPTLNCSEQIVQRKVVYTYPGAHGESEQIQCVQQFLFKAIDFADVGDTENGVWDNYPGEGIHNYYTPDNVIVPCGSSATDPASIVAYYDNPSTKDASQSPTVIENNEGIPYGYPYVVVTGFGGGFHAKPIDNRVCNIDVAYTDQVTPACGPDCPDNVKIIRTWTFIDWCKVASRQHIQLITTGGFDAPDIVINDVEASVDPWLCGANVPLPTPDHLFGECYGELTVSAYGPPGVEIINGVAVGVPKGIHDFTYVLSDCCGNEYTTPFTITVYDNTPPVAQSLENIVINLTGSPTSIDGTAKLYAVDVDNGSFDSCSDVLIEIRRDSGAPMCGNEGTPNANGVLYNNNLTYSNYSNVFPDNNRDTDNGEFVKFCCEDLTDIDENGNAYGIHKVWIRVWDDGNMSNNYGDGDNYNEVWAWIRVEDKLAPSLICPPDVTIDCSQDYTNTALTGVAFASGTCSVDEVSYDDYVDGNLCADGVVFRTWCIGDFCCEQKIVIDYNSDWNACDIFNGIIWPADYTGEAWPSDPWCGHNIDPLPALDCTDTDTGVPTYNPGPCDQLGYSLESDTFNFEEGACFKVLNNWTVINWCVYDPNDPVTGSGSGIYHHTQVIKYIDTSVPTVVGLDDGECFAVDGNCGVTVRLSADLQDGGSDCPSAWLKWTLEVDFDSDWTINTTRRGEGAPGTVRQSIGRVLSSKSEHRAIWTVEDKCGNKSSTTIFFTVEDKKAPIPYCLNLSTALMENGEVELWACDFDQGSYDDCSEPLSFTFNGPEEGFDTPESTPGWRPSDLCEGKTFTCADIEGTTDGTIPVRMYVWDACGNVDYCTVTLRLIDNMGGCENQGGGSSRIAGVIVTEDGRGVVDVQVENTVSEYGMYNMNMTDESGQYLFETNPLTLDYNIQGVKNDDYLNGVSTLDLVLIQQHILGLSDLDSAYKMIAADANNDERVSAIDLVEIRKLILGIHDEYPENDSWRFVDANQSMDEDSPWPFTEQLSIQNLVTDMLEEDFIGVKIGDVNGSVIVNLQGGNVEHRSGNKLMLNAVGNLESGQGQRIDIKASNFNDIFGMQFIMNASNMKLIGLESGSIEVTEQNIVQVGDQIRVSWNSREGISAEGVLFSMILDSDVSGSANDLLSIVSDRFISEAYQGNSLNIMDVEFGEESSVFALNQNEPNPFLTETTIGFTLPTAGKATLTVYDVSGQEVTRVASEYTAGFHQIELSRRVFNQVGIYYYTLTSGSQTATKEMIVIQ